MYNCIRDRTLYKEAEPIMNYTRIDHREKIGIAPESNRKEVCCNLPK